MTVSLKKSLNGWIETEARTISNLVIITQPGLFTTNKLLIMLTKTNISTIEASLNIKDIW